MKQLKKIALFCAALFLLINSNYFKEEKIQASRKKVYDGNTEEKGKIYYKDYSGNSYKNETSPNNPIVIGVGEQIELYVSFKDSEYNSMKETMASTVYNNDVNSTTVLYRNINDNWNDSSKRLIFGYGGNTTGECKIVYHNKNRWGDAYDTLYIQVVPTDSILIKDKYTGKYNSISEAYVDTGEEIELLAVFYGTLNMNGSKPNEENYQGSGFWSWDTTITNNWEQRFSNKWTSKVNITTQGSGIFTVGLGKNGNGQVDSISIHVDQNKILIKNIKEGYLNYYNINRNLATRMANGYTKGNNTASNRYIFYIGEEVTLLANDLDGYYFDLNNTETIKVLESSEQDGNQVKVTYMGINPGLNEIFLKNANGDVTEVFYVEVHYPIYIPTASGETLKDHLHEYLENALGDFYKGHPNDVVSDDKNSPQYVKNGVDYYMFYYLYKDNKVEITTYKNKTDTNTLGASNELNIENVKEEEITSGTKQGLVKVTAEYSVKNINTYGVVYIGNDVFFISRKDDQEKIQHIDFETEYNGAYTIIESQNLEDGKIKVIETKYMVYINKINNSKVYDSSNNIIFTIPENEYWHIVRPNSTQYESTSAYTTNEEGHVIDSDGNIVDEELNKGILTPPLKERQIPLEDINKVVFSVNMKIKPLEIDTKIYETNNLGGRRLIESSAQVIENGEERDYNNYEFVMNKKEIIDAYNVCPLHSGLDFKLQVKMLEEILSNPVTMSPIYLIGIIMIVFISIGTILFLKKKKQVNESI